MTSKAITPLEDFQRGLAAHERQFKSVLPAHIPPAKFMRTVVGAVQNNPDILKCDRASLFGACQKAAQDGLVIDGREAALVKFGSAAQYMPMVAGLLKKLRNSGQVSTITAQTVHANDSFKYNPAMDDVPNHSPDWFGDRGPMIGVYAVARMKDGGVVVEVMNLEQIDKIRGVSKSGSDKNGKPSGIWKKWPEEMAKKSVLRRIAKFLPSSADVDLMFDHDNENYDLADDAPPAPEQEQPVAKKKRKSQAAKIIEGELADDDETGPPPPENGDPGVGRDSDVI